MQIFGIAANACDVFVFLTFYLLIFLLFRLAKRGIYRWNSPAHSDKAPVTGRPLPGPWNYPIVGFLPKLGHRPFVTMWNLSRQYGEAFQIRMGSHEVLVLNGIDILKEAFVRQGKIFSGRPNFASFKALSGGKSLTFEPYSPTWRIHNKLAMRALSSFVGSKSRPIDELITRNAIRLVEQLMERSGSPLDAYELIEDSILRVVHGLCFGDAAVSDEFCEAIKRELGRMRASMTVLMPADMMPWLQRFVRSEFQKFQLTAARYASLIDELSSRVRKTISDGVDSACIVNSLVHAWEDLAVVPDASKSIEKDKVLATIYDLIGAGSEGVVNFIYWAIRYCIAYPDVQERLRTEVYNVIGEDGLPVDKDRSAMPFVEAFIWEVIRHSSMSPLTIPHSTLEDTVLAGYFVPKGTIVFGNMYSTSHDPRNWCEPELFRPERFLDPETGMVDRGRLDQFLCFGLGRRKCPGEGLGRIEMFLFLVVILQRCRFSPVEGDDLKMDGEMTLVYRSKTYKVIVSRTSNLSF